MRLLDLANGHFIEFTSPSEAPPYATLSHRWDAKEQTYQDIKEIQKLCQKNRQSSSAPLPPSLCSLSHSDAGASAIPPSPVLPQSIWDSNSGLSDKVRHICEVAREDGFRYLWIDSCCIDKASSSELSESINSMFAWYRDAELCYTFLVDVPTSSFGMLKSNVSAFRSSVWFTRGWTLQELIAPRQLVFLSQTWEPLGTKASLSELIEEITGIPASVLAGSGGGTARRLLDECSVAQRMSWAANRTTTKVEDQAYSLLGIFDIQMSLLYGEGRRAFRRLQEEILRRIPDQTIFAWGNVHPQCFSARTVDDSEPATPTPNSPGVPPQFPYKQTMTAQEFKFCPRRFNFYASGSYLMFADSPKSFAGAGQVVAVPLNVFHNLLAPYCEMSPQEYTFTPHGIRTNFPFLPLAHCLIPNQEFHQNERESVEWYLAVLACEQSDFPGQLLCCICHVPTPNPLVNALRRGSLVDVDRPNPMALDALYTLFRLSLSNEVQAGNSESNLQISPHMVYLDHPVREPSLSLVHCPDAGEPGTLIFRLPTWSRGVLGTQGYSASLAGPNEVGGGLHRLVLSPSPPCTVSGLHRWTVVVDFSYDETSHGRTIYADARITGIDPERVFPKSFRLHWTHIHVGSSGWHRHHMVQGLTLEAQGHESVRLELGVQLASVFCYRIHVEFDGGLPMDSMDY